MFGNNPVQSTWGQPQQNQQQQQQPSAFGQPANTGFGSGAFGSGGGAFGQQQQPQANPMFGNLGGTSNTPTPGTSGFGAFGSTNAANTAGGGLFGGAKPATGFGAYGGGGTSAFGGGGGTFGSTTTGAATTGTGMFGAQQSTGTSAFGGGGGLFGGAKPATGFAGPATQNPVAPVTTGTSNPPYNVYDEKDSANANANLILHYQSITCMPAYRGISFEELRWQDYQQGRKTAGSFGQSTFGAPLQQQQTTGLFGQPAASTNPAGSMFGGGGGGAFGSTSATNQPATGGFGGFGQPSTTTQTGSTGGGLFGGFGQQQNQPQQQQQPTGAFGSFGQPQQQQQQQQPATGGGLFGGSGAFGAQSQQKPFGSFGGAGTTTFGSGGTFGQQTQQPATGGGLFGQQQPQQGTSTFGAFGQPANAPKPSIFGTQPAQQTSTFGGFGATTQQQQQGQQPQQGTQPTSGLFGGGGGLFGQQQQGQQPGQQQQTGGLFGGQPAQPQPQTGGLFGGGGLFGPTSTQQQQQQQQQQNQPATTSSGFGLFGAKPAQPAAPTGGGLFGSTFGQSTTSTATQAQPQTGIFGAPLGQSTTAQPTVNMFGGAGLFGKPTTPMGGAPSTTTQPGGLFGSTLGTTTNAFGASTTAPQPSLTASIAQPIGANLPIFSMLPPGPRAVPLEQQPKKKPPLFTDVPNRTPVPRLQLGYSPASSKLRGFGSSTAGAGVSSANLFQGIPHALSLNKAASKSLLGPEAFLSGSVSGPGLGSGRKQSVKKLILDKKIEPSDLFSKSGSSLGVSFSPALSVAARELEAATAGRTGSPSPAARVQSSNKQNRFTAQSTHDILGSGSPKKTTQAEEAPAPAELKEGDYYVKPDLATLRKAGYEELVAFEGLVVGRVGYGEIHFLEPVDLTGLPKLGALLGELVRFDDKECSVYPDSDDVDKPPPGSGLNVRARIALVRCWALDKATREPVKDEKHPMAVRHLKRLKHMKDTHFESFDVEEGKWTFTVDHF